MAQLVLALNKLGKVDTAFICICAGIVVAIIAIYFLIPVFKKAQYQQQIDNLRAREAAIKASMEKRDSTVDTAVELADDTLTDVVAPVVDDENNTVPSNEDAAE